MKFFAVATLFAAAMATPVEMEARTDSAICPPGLYSYPQCCATNVLGIIGLNCAPPINSIRDARSFRDECAKYGQQALCCVLGVAGQSVLCNPVPGAN